MNFIFYIFIGDSYPLNSLIETNDKTWNKGHTQMFKTGRTERPKIEGVQMNQPGQNHKANSWKTKHIHNLGEDK